MSEKISAAALCAEALRGAHIGTPYKRLDCQALVEQLLKDCGVINPATGKAWNWRGSNHMWRAAVEDRSTIKEREPVAGEWLFTIKNDGGEIARGYHDNMGNAAHVGIYLGNGIVQHSTTGGVQWDKLTSKRWTHRASAKVVDYDNKPGSLCACWNCQLKNKCANSGYTAK